MSVPGEAQIHMLPVFPGVGEGIKGWRLAHSTDNRSRRKSFRRMKEGTLQDGREGGFNTDVGRDFILCEVCVLIHSRTFCPSVRRAAN